jgi:hypothetical protein
MSSSPLLLLEELHQDQRERWRRGERVLVESYVEKFPALSQDPPLLLGLVIREFHLRKEFGETPDPDAYLGRFPSLREQLSQALDAPTVRVTGGSGSTESGPASGLETTPLNCPHCGAEGPLRSDDDGVVRCAHCQHLVLQAPETLSLRVKPGRSIGAFELQRCVGRGQFGEVWLARDAKLRREVAIKLPRQFEDDPTHTELFLREARGAARLRHPNIVPV